MIYDERHDLSISQDELETIIMALLDVMLDHPDADDVIAVYDKLMKHRKKMLA